jgi:CheY-like chemotaxis protein
MVVSIELAAAFERAVGERLLVAERLVLSLPQLFRGSLIDCDLCYRTTTRFFAVVCRLSAADQGAETRARLQFWCARAGGVTTTLSTLSEDERAVFSARLERCDLTRMRVVPSELFEALDRLVTGAGAPPERARVDYPRPTLCMDVGGRGWEGVLFDQSQQTLFIPGNIAPPTGDEFAVALRVPGAERPVEVKARVNEVRSPEESRPGTPAGFTLLMQAPAPPLVAALVRAQSLEPDAASRRTAPRYALKAPVKVIIPPAPEAGGAGLPEAAAQPAAPLPLARIEYATDRELAADYVANLSQGGAYVHTAQPRAIGTRVMLEMLLPGGVQLEAPATVVFAREDGMGVKFELDPAGNETLSAVIARISARPRRALVVDDDGMVRRMLADALGARGFEVLTASDGASGLQIVVEEVLTLDLLITDLKMPNLDGETFVRTIRQAGGESELAIVVITGSPEPGMEKRLETTGADTVLDKALGPELIAQASDAVLERKRLLRG